MPISRSEYIRNKRKRLFWKVGLFFGGLILIFALLSFLSYRKSVRISAVELAGGILVTRAEVEKEAISRISGTYFWMFPKDSIFLYMHSNLPDYLKDKFKRIDTISVKRKNWQTLEVAITERKPESLWCEGNAGAENTSEKCYFMDSNGTIFADAPNFSGDAYFKYYGLVSVPETGSPVGLSYVASTTQFRDLTQFVSRLKAMSLSPQYLTGDANDQFSVVLAGGAKILFDLRESLDKVADNLSILVHSNPFNDPTRVGAMADYIDLRFGNKLYYKLR